MGGGLVDQLGREAGHPVAQKKYRRPTVNLATTELLDGVSDQRERLVSTAGEGVGSAEGRGDVSPGDDLPRSAEVEAPLEGLDRAWEIPATQMDVAAIVQPAEQREGMIGRFTDPHGGLGVPDGLVEPAELREHVGEASPRERRLDDVRPEALEAQVALERDVPLKQGGRIAELAPGGVCHAQEGRCDHLNRAIAEGARDGEGFLPESGGFGVVVSEIALEHHEGGDSREPVLVAEGPGEHLRFAEMVPHACPIQREKRVPEVEADVDGQLGRLPDLGEVTNAFQRLFQMGDGLAVGRPRHGRASPACRRYATAFSHNSAQRRGGPAARPAPPRRSP